MALKTMAMQSSSSEDSYAQKSGIQNQTFHKLAKPVLAKAVEQLLCNIAVQHGHDSPAQGRKHITIADLGCSYGRNTLDCAEFMLGALQQNWAGNAADKMPEIQYFFSDLPSNDFNALFQSLHPYLFHPPNCNSIPESAEISRPRSTGLPRMYAAGVPGSFHGRLFPSASLDLVICSYSLHWLSQVPHSIVDKSSPAWNGGHTWIHKASQNVVDAYALQSQLDLRNFLKSRSHELVSGGILFLFILGFTSNSKYDSSSNYHSPRWELFDSAWKELVNEGIITMEELDTFNIPMYLINEPELENVLIDVPEFKVLHMETIENKAKQEWSELHPFYEYFTSVTKATVETHLGEQKSKALYRKLKDICSKQNGLEASFSNNLVVAYLTRL